MENQMLRLFLKIYQYRNDPKYISNDDITWFFRGINLYYHELSDNNDIDLIREDVLIKGIMQWFQGSGESGMSWLKLYYDLHKVREMARSL